LYHNLTNSALARLVGKQAKKVQDLRVVLLRPEDLPVESFCLGETSPPMMSQGLLQDVLLRTSGTAFR
jgi:hypothetical protein